MYVYTIAPSGSGTCLLAATVVFSFFAGGWGGVGDIAAARAAACGRAGGGSRQHVRMLRLSSAL